MLEISVEICGPKRLPETGPAAWIVLMPVTSFLPVSGLNATPVRSFGKS